MTVDVLTHSIRFVPFVMSDVDSDQLPTGDENNNDNEKMDTSAAPAVADGDDSITAHVRPDDFVMDDVAAAIGEVQVAVEIAGTST